MMARLAGWIAAFVAWVREETRLATADNWEREDMRHEPAPLPCTASDPRCAATLERLAEARARMARMKSGLLDGDARTRPYTRGADVEATFRRVRATVASPVRMVTARKASR